MKICVIWCVLLLAMAGNALSETKEQRKELVVDLGNGLKLELVLIPAGSFLMGDASSDYEKPVHKVNIAKPYYLGKYEVTQEQWRAVMGKNPSRFKGSKNPVERVSWSDCQAFLEKLSTRADRKEGKFALPTEAQWEYACRAGSTTQFSFGDDEGQLKDYAWYRANSEDKTHPVGRRKPNAWGLYDMHGNVWEWCADWYHSGYYAKSPADDPTGPTKGSTRVYRGGCWQHPAWDCRSAFRDFGAPGDSYDYLGLRVSYMDDDNKAIADLTGISPQNKDGDQQ